MQNRPRWYLLPAAYITPLTLCFSFHLPILNARTSFMIKDRAFERVTFLPCSITILGQLGLVNLASVITAGAVNYPRNLRRSLLITLDIRIQ